MKKLSFLTTCIFLMKFCSYAQTKISKSSDIINNKLEEKYFKLPETISTKKHNQHQIYTLPFLQLDSSIIENINSDSSLYIKSEKKEYIYDSISGNIREEINSIWDDPNSTWLNATKKIFTFINSNTLRTEENYDWDTNTLSWVAKNKHEYSYGANGEIDSNLFFTFNTASQLWIGSNADIFHYDVNNNLVNYTRDRWDTLNNLWIHELKNDYTYNIGNYRVENINAFWDTISNQWINSYKVTNTYDLIPNLIFVNGFIWDTNLSLWQDDQKIALSYDASNNRLTDTTFTWNTGNLSWSPNELHNYSYDLSNNLTENITSSWDSNLSVWNSSDKHEYSYDLNNNKTNDTYSYWNGISWKYLFKSSFSNHIDSFSTENANYIWDEVNTIWTPIDKQRLNHSTSVLFSDIILPFYLSEEEFHHKLDTKNSYVWDNNNLSYSLTELNTYYYSNTSIGLNEKTITNNILSFPNPAKDIIYFDIPSAEKNYTISIYDCTGAKLLCANNSKQLVISNFANGIYFFSVNSSGNLYRGKFIKE